jgi:dipeptidyl aminopeptidase/acylaminoacyl peptidase
VGPVVQETRGREAQVRTFQDLLADAHDEALFDHYFTSQLALVDAGSGEKRMVGEPAIFAAATPSPDGRYMLVGKVERPYSYLVPWNLFPQKWEIWDVASGAPRVVRELSRAGLRDDIPIQGVQTGPRGYSWHALEDATLLWVEALDEGDPRNKVPHRDRVMVMRAPFEGDGRELLKTEHRYAGMSFLADGRVLVSENDRDRRWNRTWLYELRPMLMVALQGAKIAPPPPRVVWDRSARDRYGDPGSPLTERLPNGRWAIRIENESIYLSGQGASPEGDRPFLDRMSLHDFSTQRLWRNEGANYESVVDIMDGDASLILTVRESPEEPANYFVRALGAGENGGGTRTQITFFPDPAPELRGIRKQLVTYTRDDGVPLSATLYLPAGYEPERDGPLPLVVWAYPLEFNDPATAGQVSGSPHRFTRIGGTSHLFLLTQGYAIMDAATMPIVGDPETANDTFVEQIVAAAKAAIDTAVEMGVADRERVAVGGHSYGAFMTANLLAHSDLFKAGLARSGAYNRTLTPFGFQGERRTFWQAAETYMNLSPFTHAHKIKAPILLIHGQMDNNAGTFPMQSERLFHAINGHGGTARLVMLPYEGHGYQARESVMHVLAEMVEWLDRHVKGAGGEENERRRDGESKGLGE